jgi:hypothetical protein
MKIFKILAIIWTSKGQINMTTMFIMFAQNLNTPAPKPGRVESMVIQITSVLISEYI